MQFSDHFYQVTRWFYKKVTDLRLARMTASKHIPILASAVKEVTQTWNTS